MARPFLADYKVHKYRRRVLVVHALARSALAALSCLSVDAPDGGHWAQFRASLAAAKYKGPCKRVGARSLHWRAALGLPWLALLPLPLPRRAGCCLPTLAGVPESFARRRCILLATRLVASSLVNVMAVGVRRRWGKAIM